MFACIYIPDFHVEAIVRTDPLMRERAVAVLDGKPPLVRVIALNEKARQLGMETGMTKLQAAIFAEKEGQVSFSQKTALSAKSYTILRQRSLEQEKSAHSALLDLAFGFTPRVEDTADDRLLLDLSGLERLHGSSSHMAGELATRIQAAGLEGNVAIAANPDSAMHAACGFSGTTIIPPGEESRRLGVLPLQVLLDCFGLPRSKQSRSLSEHEHQKLREQMLDTLERWGVRDFRTLALLPEHALASRLGEVGARLQRLARGAEVRTLTLCDPEICFEEALELEYPVELLESLSFLINRLLEQLCARLEARALAAHELQIRLQLEKRAADEETATVQELLGSHDVPTGVFYERRLRLPIAMRNAKVFLKLLQLDLAAHPPGAPIVKLWISAQPAPLRSAQRGLFLPLTPEVERLELTLARIAGIVGECRAGTVRLLDTHRPDAFAMERFSVAEGQERSSGSPTLSENGDGDTPALALRRFRPPRQLAVCTSEGRPTVINSQSEIDQISLQGMVLWSAGPWRCSGEWWGEHSAAENGELVTGPWDREEWDIALQHQPDNSVGLYRIYREVGSGQWFAHASYD